MSLAEVLTIEANSSNLESKLLVALAKVDRSHIYDREQLCRGGVDLQNSPFLTFAELKEKKKIFLGFSLYSTC